MKKVRVGVVGQGRSGYNIHVSSLSRMPEQFQVVAVCDPLIDRCREAERDLGSAVYADYREMLKRDDLDLVINASPSHLHVPITKEIMSAGFNVLCEKPLARRASEVDQLIELSRKTGKLFAIYQQSRFSPAFRQIKSVIDSGVLGRIVMIKCAYNDFARRWDWQTVQEYNGGNLLNTGPHPMDQMLELFGGDSMPNITCVMDRANTYGDAEDHVKILMHGSGHPTIDLEISSCCAYPLYSYQVYGVFGGLTGTLKRLEWKYFKPAEESEHELIREPFPGRGYCTESLNWHTDSWEPSPEEADFFHYMAREFYASLYDSLTNGSPLVVTPQRVRRQIAVIEECHRQNPLSASV
jgi:predicted dehydrogenase